MFQQNVLFVWCSLHLCKMHLGFPRIKGTATLDIMLPGCYSRMPSTGANKLHLVLYTEIGTCPGDYF